MPLDLKDHRAMLTGFEGAGYVCTRAPDKRTNPIKIQWYVGGQRRRYRLWTFDITHGGGGPKVRAADELRIQITNAPSTLDDLDKEDAIDLLLGYSREADVIVAYDRRWLETAIRNQQESGSRGSPSVQIKAEHIEAARDGGIFHFTKPAKPAKLGDRHILTMRPSCLPAYLFNHGAALRGEMSADELQPVTLQPSPATIVDYCRSRGFPFAPDLIARYLAALLAKPFVILAGVSGTGKSKLAELVAEFYSAAPTRGSVPRDQLSAGNSFEFRSSLGPPDPTRFALVAVRPDWTDHQSILGFVNPITERYESTQALDLILMANRALDAAETKSAAPRYFMLLDEMNLARVEYYFSDWLACSESRRPRPDGSISQQAVPLHRSTKSMKTKLVNPDGSPGSLQVSPSVALPTNLVVTGTVNVDETTYGLSPKVLDRAMVIEFDEVDLGQLRSSSPDAPLGNRKKRKKKRERSYRFPDPDDLPPFQLATKEDYAALPERTHLHLTALNDLLKETRLHLGYRAANEIALFMKLYNDILPEDPDDTDWLRALDAAVLQKVLPRLSGNRAKLEAPLAGLCAYLRDLERDSSDVRRKDFGPGDKAKLPNAYRRAVDMLSSLRDFGFVSFFK